MADWKTQVTYNYSPSYHTYAYSLLYQPGHEQNHGNLNVWTENGVTDLSNYNTGAMQNYYSTSAARNPDQTQPGCPELPAVNGHCYQGPGVVYIGDTQAGRLLLAGQHRGAYVAPGNEVRRSGSDSASDSEAHTSPDSWSSGSSREGSVPQADPATWVEKDAEVEAIVRSPGGSEDVSSSLMEEPPNFGIEGNEAAGNPMQFPGPSAAPKKKGTAVVNNPKAKVRAAFSESQMNALVQRFTIQRYLTPAEMKNLAEMTGLTYKQVKTWFQNRRMKLRRHQKDTSWVSERFTINKDSPVHGALFSNMGSHIPPYQGEGKSPLREQYNQRMMEAAFKKNPQNLAFYLAAMGSAGSAGYPPWSASSAQMAAPNRSQVTCWPVPPGGSHFEYNPSGYNSAAASNVNNFGHNASFENKDCEPMSSQCSLTPDMVDDSRQ